MTTPTDWEGRPIPADELPDAIVTVWEVEPHPGSTSHTHYVCRSWQEMLAYVRSHLDGWLEDHEAGELQDGITLTFRLAEMSKSELTELESLDD